MSRKGTPDELERTLSELRRLYAHQRIGAEARTEIEVRRQTLDNEARALAARIEKLWAIAAALLRSEATGEPLPEHVDTIGTPALIACPNCNGAGCTYCNGQGTVPNHAARDATS